MFFLRNLPTDYDRDEYLCMRERSRAVCGECGVDFRLRSLLRRHLARYRLDADTRIRELAYGYDLHRHGNEFVECPLCRHVFSSSYQLRAHRRLCRAYPHSVE